MITEEQAPQTIDLVELLAKVVCEIERNDELQHDLHMREIISWWMPQFLEMITVLLLCTDSTSSSSSLPSSPSSDSQSDYKMITQFYDEYQKSLLVCLYLMSGEYLLQNQHFKKFKSIAYSPENNIVTNSIAQKGKADNNAQNESNVFQLMEEKTKKLTSCLRKRLSSLEKETTVNMSKLSRTSSSRLHLLGRAQSSTFATNAIYCWKDVFALNPQIYSSTIYLFLSYIPEDIRMNFALDISDINIKYYSAHHFVDPLSSKLLDALKVSDAVENIRQNWPYLFTEKSTQSLFRAVAFHF